MSHMQEARITSNYIKVDEGNTITTYLSSY